MGEDPQLLEKQAQDQAEAGDYAAALALRERAFSAWRAAGDLRRAAYLAAYQIAFDHVALFGNSSVAHGWLERGRHLAEEAGECAQSGWVALASALHESDPPTRGALVREAARLADRYGDDDLRFDALAHSGLMLVEDGRVSEGMRQLDEAAAAARGGEVASQTVAGEIYCKLLVACEATLDVRRAEEWHPVTSPLEERLDVAWASAICRMHYGGILVAAGRWPEAEAELATALRLYDASYRALRTAALVRLADLRVQQGRLGEAAQLLTDQARESDAIRPWARMAWQQSRNDEDRSVVAARLGRHLRSRAGDILAVPLLALLVEMEVACGRQGEAQVTARSLTRLTAGEPVAALVGYARTATAVVAAADGDAAGAVAALEEAIESFRLARLPLEEARARLQLAEVVAPADPALARAEARTAAESFAWLGASDGLDRATALLRGLGERPARAGAARDGGLTDREQEVLALVAQGLSNPQIAERLFISRKTASHHVSHLLAKLGLSTRAEAAAWASARGRDGRR